MLTKGQKFLSDLKFFTDYSSYREEFNRYETWEEAATDVFDTHRKFYKDKLTDELKELINEAEQGYKDKKFLASQRTLQFRNDSIINKNQRLYNCSVLYADKISFLGNAHLLLLSGCGVGVNMMDGILAYLPKIKKPSKGIKQYIIEDSIEGWANATHALMSSYSEKPIEGFEEFYGYQIKFDYSLIRPKGSIVSGKFKAPGHEPLRNSHEKIEKLLNDYCTDDYKVFRGIDAYDIFMHLADSVIAGGVRRSACNIILSKENKELLNAKTGNWFVENPQRGRSNNSVGLLKKDLTKEEFKEVLAMNDGMSDIGFVFMNNIFEIYNPCFEIGFIPIDIQTDTKEKEEEFLERIRNSDPKVLTEKGVKSAIQFCNLNEINLSKCNTPEKFYEACKLAAITGTLQAGYTNFPNFAEISEETERITRNESLLGVSGTGWASQPWLFENSEVLREGARIVKETNSIVAKIIGINPAARSTTVKPSGNASVLLSTPSGIHPEHSRRYFRIMQLNKESETGKYLIENFPEIIEESVYSANNTDYVVFVPIENKSDTLLKSELQGIKHLEKIKFVKENWVDVGKRVENCLLPEISHNVSNTVIIDDMDQISDYIFDNKNIFAAVSFISQFGDKDYNQAPFTSVLNMEEIIEKYGEGSMFASGLIVDGLHAFDNNLWEACDHIINQNRKFSGNRIDVMIKKEWVRRAKKFARNYFNNDLYEMVYCLKDVHLFHKWCTINKRFKKIDFTKVLKEPKFIDIDTTSAKACSGGSCEIV